MLALLDVNVLIALVDGAHIQHETAHDWFASHRAAGWASCPITENGLVRVLSSPSYPGRRTTVQGAIHHLQLVRASGFHSFWPDSLSISEPDLIEPRHVTGHRQLTDVYLLAMAVRRNARLATFDRGLAIASVTGASSDNVALIG